METSGDKVGISDPWVTAEMAWVGTAGKEGREIGGVGGAASSFALNCAL